MVAPILPAPTSRTLCIPLAPFADESRNRIRPRAFRRTPACTGRFRDALRLVRHRLQRRSTAMHKAPTPHNSAPAGPVAASPATGSPLNDYQWAVQPLAEQIVQDVLEDAAGRSPFVAELRRRMREETGTRLFDWVDHLVVPDAGGLREQL